MHIGVLTHNYPRFPGDFSGTFIEALCQEWARQGQQVTVLAPYDPAYRRSLDGPVRLCVYRYVWPDWLHRLGYMRTMRSDLALRFEAYLLSPALLAAGIAVVARWVHRERPDLLHAHWVLPNGFIGAVVSRWLSIPLVVSIPGSDAQIARQNFVFRRMARFAFQQAALLTANSAELREVAITLGADPDKFDLILYGVDPEALRPSLTGVAELRARLDIPNWAIVLLAVGRMVPKKGFDVLLRAMARPPLSDRPVVTVMVGRGDEMANWQRLANQLGIAGRVRWVGTVPKDELVVYYNMADILVMPSVSKPADGLNVCVLDAMSCARPVVGSNVAGNPLAIVDGVTGLIVPEGDVDALAQALARLADDPDLRARMGAAGRARIENELGWPHLARRYLAHFAQITSPNGQRQKSDHGQ
jgi:glycosyltransferase involved in cell wall biosynthesis